MRKLLVFVCFFLFFFLPMTVAAHEEAGKRTVHINADGFEPESLTIEVGETVVFENTGEEPHWPASDIHPTHAIYSEFDPKRELEPGESWEFTFKRSGEWRMHDHLFPENTGGVVVQGIGAKDGGEKVTQETPILTRLKQKVLEIYYKLFPGRVEAKLKGHDMRSIAQDEKLLSFYLTYYTPEEAMQKLLDESGGGSVYDCHQEAHIIGRKGYEAVGADIFAKGDSSCHSGFYHGAMEAFLAEEGTSELGPKIEALCDSFESSFGRFECLHGVGHGVLAYEDYDLLKALEVCRSLTDDFSVSSCYGGVFMENVVTGQGRGAVAGHTTAWLSEEDLHYPCNALGGDLEAIRQCYQMQTSWILTVSAGDFEEVSDECSQAPEGFEGTCFLSMGRDAAGYSLRNPDSIIEKCQYAPDEYFSSCIAGGLNVIVDFWGERVEEQPFELCNKLEGENKKSCYMLLAVRLADVFGDNTQRIEAVCKNVEGQYHEICIGNKAS